ncbi:MAG TPA: Smr/MutS family protein [Flavobacterium sp.]|nr:Smr/MutS family protein [Flavobacterium sp.]
MMKKFNIGDYVEVLDDDLKGTVVAFENEEYVIETNEGFRLNYPAHALILSGDKNVIREASMRSAVGRAKSEKVDSKKKYVQPNKRTKDEFVFKVDLHIEKLIAKPGSLNNFEKLNLQVDTARAQLEFAQRNNIRHIVFIHGMGDGVLKAELEFLFGRYSDLVYQDADYHKYGLGATEVFLNYKGL